ncbi:MAG TPA: paraquat-inducible protein A [Opitutus sp.]|nr:paraquat-inducible protein A [Opitutus sp.]
MSAAIRPFRHASVAALALAAVVMLVPANLIPVISTNLTGQVRDDTIFSGIVVLWKQGLWGIAAIVFTASLLVPFLKLAGVSVLLLAARRPPSRHARPLTRLYATLDFIGRWSMLDVFLVAFLSGLVQFGSLATVAPRPGIVAFAAAVVLTMLATQAYDPRALWVAAPSAAAVAPNRDGHQP